MHATTLLTILAATFLMTWRPASAATRRVPSEYATINMALDAATRGDSVLVAPGTYSAYEVRMLHGGGPFTASSIAFLKGGVSLIGEGGRGVTHIDLADQGEGHAVPVLAYSPGPGAILVEGFTITGAPVGSTGMWSRFMDQMVIRACRFENLDGGSTRPGGLYSETVDLKIYDSEFVNCRIGTGPYRQAAIEHIEGDALLEGCVFEDCVGPVIVNLNALGTSPPFDAVVRNCQFRNNSGLAAGIISYVSLTVEDCTFVGNHTTGYAGLVVSGGGGGIVEPGPYVLRGNVFANHSTRAVDWDRVSGSIEGNTFVGNDERALTLDYDAQHSVTVSQNVFSYTNGIAVRFIGSLVPLPASQCNVFWENTTDIEGYPPGSTDLFVDPQFCDRDGGDYSLASSSPCLPPSSGACGQIGAFGQGCSGVAVEAETWARTKARYRVDANGRREP